MALAQLLICCDSWSIMDVLRKIKSMFFSTKSTNDLPDVCAVVFMARYRCSAIRCQSRLIVAQRALWVTNSALKSVLAVQPQF